MAAQQKERRVSIVKGDWKGKGGPRKAMQGLLAAEQATERVALKARHKQEREQLRHEFPPCPGFEQWLIVQGKPEAARQWRYRESEPGPLEAEDDQLSQKSVDDFGGIHLVEESGHVRAWIQRLLTATETADGLLYTWQNGCPACRDRGNRIELCENLTSASSELILDLMKAKGLTAVSVTGTTEFKRLMAERLTVASIKVKNPELANYLAQLRTKTHEPTPSEIEFANLLKKHGIQAGGELLKLTTAAQIEIMAAHDKLEREKQTPKPPQSTVAPLRPPTFGVALETVSGSQQQPQQEPPGKSRDRRKR